MTRITVSRDPRGGIRWMRAQGHAGMGVEGEDVVCAAISALMQTAGIASAKRGGEPRADEGETSVVIPAPDLEARDMQVIFQAIYDGLLAIERQYPESIGIQEV